MTFQYCFDGSIKKVNNLSVSSPRTWGCFYDEAVYEDEGGVFPTHVGVFPRYRSRTDGGEGLPHARGGVSAYILFFLPICKSSPRTWGCFLCSCLRFAAIVGLPHARGGVSALIAVLFRFQPSSPRTWGCFWTFACGFVHGVSLPHARGGVSSVSRPDLCVVTSSPRTWGCFHQDDSGA